MRTTTKQLASVVIPPKLSRPTPTPLPFKLQGPRILTALLCVLMLAALLRLMVAFYTSPTVVHSASCQDLINRDDYTKSIPLQRSTQQIGAIQSTNQLTNGQPSVLVPVIDSGPQHRLDVYIFGCDVQQQQPALTLNFMQQGLVQGSVNVSRANTLLISQLDPAIAPSASVLMLPLQANIEREYSWQNGTFLQVAFPGLYPVTSRGQAEALQDQENEGQQLLWNDPQATAQQMAQDLFHWSNPQAIVQDNDGTTAHILLLHQTPSLAVSVTLTRLLQHNSTGLWFVTQAQTQGITLDRSRFQTPLASPLTFQGTSTLKDEQITATLFDHTLSPIRLLKTSFAHLNQDGTVTGRLLYTTLASNQPGLLLIEQAPLHGSTATGQLLLTNLLLGS